MTQVMTPEQMLQEIARLQAENATLQKAKPSGSIKVSAKGAVSVYGLGRYPVTLYASQWEQLFSRTEEVKAFILAHTSELSTKEKADA